MHDEARSEADREISRCIPQSAAKASVSVRGAEGLHTRQLELQVFCWLYEWGCNRCRQLVRDFAHHSSSPGCLQRQPRTVVNFLCVLGVVDVFQHPLRFVRHAHTALPSCTHFELGNISDGSMLRVAAITGRQITIGRPWRGGEDYSQAACACREVLLFEQGEESICMDLCCKMGHDIRRDGLSNI